MSDEDKKKRHAELSKIWRLNNPDKWKEIRKKSLNKPENIQKSKSRTKDWREKNRDKVNSTSREWAKRNPDKVKDTVLKCNRKNKDKVNERNRKKHNAKKSSVLVTYYKKQIKEIYKQARERTKETGIKYVVDHIMPLIGPNFSGLHVPWNLQIITFDENVKKSNKVS